MTTVFKSPEAAAEVYACYRAVLKDWPAPATQLRLPTCEGETFVIASGADDAPPLVLLHGSQANAAAWMFDAALWSRSFRVYAVDMIGEAGFSAPSRPPFDSDAHARWLDDVMNGLGIARAAFVGASLGGWVALDYAIRRPQRVAKLALLCPAGIGRQKNFLLKAAPLLLLGPWGARKMREMVFGRAFDEPPAEARPVVALMTLIGRHFKPRIIRIRVFDDRALAALGMPMLVIVGGRDVLLDSAETKRRLQRLIPHARVDFLPGARHFLPDQGGTILSFLREPREMRP